MAQAFSIEGVEFSYDVTKGQESVRVGGEVLVEQKRGMKPKVMTFEHAGHHYDVTAVNGFGAFKFTAEKDSFAAPVDTQGMPPLVIAACAWPLALVAFGGAIGGALGGGAAAGNMAVYKSSLPLPVKVLANIGLGAAAFGIWALIAGALNR